MRVFPLLCNLIKPVICSLLTSYLQKKRTVYPKIRTFAANINVMKKIFWILIAFVMLNASGAMAQDKAINKSNKRAGAPAKAENSTAVPAAQTAPAAKTKKDGTPDMRYSENKSKQDQSAPAPAGPMKKDGTPDMRHKANKKASATAKDATAEPKQK